MNNEQFNTINSSNLGELYRETVNSLMNENIMYKSQIITLTQMLEEANNKIEELTKKDTSDEEAQ